MSYIQKFQDSENTQKISHHLNLAFNKKLVLAFLVALAIPVTITLSSRQQTTENHAAAPAEPESDGYIVVFKDKALVDKMKPSSTMSSPEAQKSVENLRLNIESQHKIIKTNLLSILGASSFTTDESPTSSEVKILGEFENGLNAVALDINSDQAEKLKTQSPYVQAVYPNLIVHATLMDSVPLINASRAWGVKDSTGSNDTGKGVNVAIIDTGVDYTSSDLGGSRGGQIFNSKVVDGADFINDDEDPMDDEGHGTHVAGIIAGNGVVKGVAPGANVIAYKVLSSSGSGTFATVIEGIDAAIATHTDADPTNDISIINLSLGASCGSYKDSCGPDDLPSQEIDKASSYGIVTIVAAGNATGGVPGTIYSPGTARTAITVGSIDKNKAISVFSSRGPVAYNGEIINKPDVVAPGEGYPVSDYKTDPRGGICSTKSSDFKIGGVPNCDSTHVALRGTSMAAPHVAGIAALVKQKYPQYTSSDIKYLITQNTTNLGYDVNTQGKGMVDAAKIFSIGSNSPIISLTPTPLPVVTKTTTITAYQDSYVNQNSSGSNYGTLSRIKIDGSPKEVSYLKFDLTPLKGKKIISAKLKLKVPKVDGSGSSNKFSIKKIDQSDWSEGSVKYSNKPSLGATVTTFTGKGPGNTITIDGMKNAVAAGAGSKVSWGITGDGSNELILYSRNYSSNRPQLVIEYQ